MIFFVSAEDFVVNDFLVCAGDFAVRLLMEFFCTTENSFVAKKIFLY